MFCKNCGFENENGAVFCSNCGTTLEEANDVISDYSEQEYQPDVGYTDEVYSEVAEPQVETKKVFGILSIVFGAVSIVLLAGGCCCSTLGGVITAFISGLGSVVGLIPTIIALVLPIPGIVLGAVGISKAKKAGTKDGLSIAGLVVSIVALVMGIAYIVIPVILVVVFGVSAVGLGALGGLMEGGYYGGYYY